MRGFSMSRSFSLLLAACLGACSLAAQEDRTPQFHGFVTQGFAYSDGNNYLGMDTNSGSAGWTEGAVNINDQLTHKLRVGAQFHSTKLGQFGSWVPGVDWALADYKVNQWLGIRAGKVKIRWGLFNDTQDADPGYLWSLLPEPMYAVDWRTTNLSQLGAELYGRVRLGTGRGELEYSLYYGHYTYASNDGYMEGFKQSGIDFSKRPGGITPGFDLRWKTPVKGLVLGGSLMLYNAKGSLVDGTFREPLTFWPTYYAQYSRRKFFVSGQYMRLVQYTDVAMGGEVPSSSLADTRAWFAMGGYHLTDKLQAGIYYTHYVVAASDQSDPVNHFRDTVVSGRYDFNSFFYSKLEGHFIDGTGLGFYGFDNPGGLKPQTRLVVAKVGFSF
jgi:hypothetical protein